LYLSMRPNLHHLEAGVRRNEAVNPVVRVRSRASQEGDDCLMTATAGSAGLPPHAPRDSWRGQRLSPINRVTRICRRTMRAIEKEYACHV
jgi:hypothetical protein